MRVCSRVRAESMTSSSFVAQRRVGRRCQKGKGKEQEREGKRPPPRRRSLPGRKWVDFNALRTKRSTVPASSFPYLGESVGAVLIDSGEVSAPSEECFQSRHVIEPRRDHGRCLPLTALSAGVRLVRVSAAAAATAPKPKLGRVLEESHGALREVKYFTDETNGHENDGRLETCRVIMKLK